MRACAARRKQERARGPLRGVRASLPRGAPDVIAGRPGALAVMALAIASRLRAGGWREKENEEKKTKTIRFLKSSVSAFSSCPPAMQEHQGGDRDVQYAMEAAYTSEAPPPAHGGDAYSQSLEPPMLSSFGEVEDARAPANGDPDKLNAEESAALRSFLAGGGESGEGVVLDWGVVLPLAQALAISLAFVAAIVGICTDSWKVQPAHPKPAAGCSARACCASPAASARARADRRSSLRARASRAGQVGVSLGGHRAAVGLSELRVDADEPGAAGLLSLHDLCNGLVQPAVAAANGTVAASPMAAEMACAYKRAGAAVIGLVGAALALLAALLLTNLCARGRAAVSGPRGASRRPAARPPPAPL